MTPKKITISVEVPLAPEQAWQVYTDPNEVIRWNFASDDWHCPSVSNDLRVGEFYNARMEAKDGSFGFDFEGRYSEVEAPHALTLVLGDGRESRTTFMPSEKGTRVQTVFDPEPSNPVEMQQAGWQAILSNYQRRAEEVSGN